MELCVYNEGVWCKLTLHTKVGYSTDIKGTKWNPWDDIILRFGNLQTPLQILSQTSKFFPWIKQKKNQVRNKYCHNYTFEES